MEMGFKDRTNRFSKKQSGSGFSAKSKKRRMLKKQEEITHKFSPSDLDKKKSKLLKKSLKVSNNGVDHASIPRKLRSAMKKRNLESVSKLSSATKRLNRFKTDSVKKEDQEMEEEKSMMISKDEKEVAETLFGLAGMFTETDSIDKKTCCDPLCDEKETNNVVESSLVMETDFPAVSVLSSAETKQTDEKPLDQSEKQSSSTGMVDFLERLKQSSSENVTTDATAKAVETKVATSELDYKSNVQSGSSYVLSKLPPWMGQAVSPSKSASPLRVQPRKLSKCASHIYIARLIKALQTGKNSPTTRNQTEQRSLEVSERRLPDPATTISTVSSTKRYQNSHILDINRPHNPKTAQEGMTQISLELYSPHTLQKQRYDFLSLSSPGVSSQSHFTLPNSFPQYPIPAAYNNHLSTATSSHQLSPYQANRFQTAYTTNQQQQQQLQKRLWAAASQYKQPTKANNTAPSSNQYCKPNLSLNLTSSSIQPLQVASSPRYNNNVSQQQQQQHSLMAAAAAMSMSHRSNNNSSRTVMNRQEHHFPFIYEDSRTPLQLLCNEQY